MQLILCTCIWFYIYISEFYLSVIDLCFECPDCFFIPALTNKFFLLSEFREIIISLFPYFVNIHQDKLGPAPHSIIIISGNSVIYLISTRYVCKIDNFFFNIVVSFLKSRLSFPSFWSALKSMNLWNHIKIKQILLLTHELRYVCAQISIALDMCK